MLPPAEKFPEKLHFFLEALEGLLVSGVRYVLIILLFFGISIALISFASGEGPGITAMTPEGGVVIYSIVVVALVMVWREAREVRLWLSGISKGHSEGIYSKIGTGTFPGGKQGKRKKG
ncbi:MAG: hypothetical protein V1820_03185 [archaeon]